MKFFGRLAKGPFLLLDRILPLLVFLMYLGFQGGYSFAERGGIFGRHTLREARLELEDKSLGANAGYLLFQLDILQFQVVD